MLLLLPSAAIIFLQELMAAAFISRLTAARTGQTSIPDWAPAINAFAVSGSKIFAGTWGGIYLSTNSGTSGQQSIGLTNGDVYVFAVSGNNVLAGTGGRVFFRLTAA